MSLLVAFAIFCVIGLLKLVQALLEVPVIKAFVTRTNDAVKKRQELARELLDMQRELLVISPKDEFVRWAKLSREFNKKLQIHNQLKANVSGSHVKSRVYTAGAVLVLSIVSQLVFITSYRSTPMFYLPVQWTEPFTWFLSLPSAPYGSVGVVVWVQISFALWHAVGDVVFAAVNSALSPPTPASVSDFVPSPDLQLNVSSS